MRIAMGTTVLMSRHRGTGTSGTSRPGGVLPKTWSITPSLLLMPRAAAMEWTMLRFM
jgi:hypothetical protein